MAAEISIEGEDFFAEVFTNFVRARNSELHADFTVSLAPGMGDAIALDGVTFVDSTKLTAQVPATVSRALYDVVVTDPNGSSGKLTGALRVVTPAESVAAFELDPILGQRAGVPFVVGVTAVDEAGTRVEGFDGTAQLMATGSIPVSIGPFALGRARGFVTVPQPAMALTVTATDAQGHAGVSEPFDVTPGEPARVAFVDAPARIAAGACGGPFTLEVQDTFGNPAAPSASSAFSVSVNPPEGGEPFMDAACTTTSAAGMLQGRASFYVRATKAGRPQLRVVPEAWPSALRELDVDAGVAVGLEIASAPQVLAAGMCSQPVVVRARDAFGNAAVVAAPVALGADLQPSTGVTLHDEGTCATPLNALEIAAGAAEARFHFRSAVPAMLELRVDGGVLGVAVQGEEVTP